MLHNDEAPNDKFMDELLEWVKAKEDTERSE
jgi:hypothetical protein